MAFETNDPQEELDQKQEQYEKQRAYQAEVRQQQVDESFAKARDTQLSNRLQEKQFYNQSILNPRRGKLRALNKKQNRLEEAGARRAYDALNTAPLPPIAPPSPPQSPGSPFEPTGFRPIMEEDTPS